MDGVEGQGPADAREGFDVVAGGVPEIVSLVEEWEGEVVRSGDHELARERISHCLALVLVSLR